MSKIIRISDGAKTRIALIAESTGRPMTDLLDDAVDALERRLFMVELDRRYTSLRADADAWSEIEAERREWGGTLRDDID